MPLGDTLDSIGGTEFARIRTALSRLGGQPPQVLLLEGGNEASRWACALFWAMRVNCPNVGNDSAPCLACPTCQQIRAGEHVDLLAYEGRISNREDSENPGLVRALNMDNIRDLKACLGTAPHGRMRVVVLLGLTNQRGGAANALLKQLEEPTANTRFVLLTPQREQLLPTLVSRSFCLSLPWPDRHSTDPAVAAWEDDVALFLTTGRGLLDKLTARGAVDATLAAGLVLAMQKALARVLAGEQTGHALDSALARLDAKGLATCKHWLDDAQDMLAFAVTPARVMEALVMNLCLLVNGKHA